MYILRHADSGLVRGGQFVAGYKPPKGTVCQLLLLHPKANSGRVWSVVPLDQQARCGTDAHPSTCVSTMKWCLHSLFLQGAAWASGLRADYQQGVLHVTVAPRQAPLLRSPCKHRQVRPIAGAPLATCWQGVAQHAPLDCVEAGAAGVLADHHRVCCAQHQGLICRHAG